MIGRDVRDRVNGHLASVLPEEGCGLLSGRRREKGTGTLAVVQAWPVRNREGSATAYCMDAREQLLTERLIRERGEEVLAIYHSHPASDAFPSRTDLERAFWPGTADLLYPERAWVIVSMQTREEPDWRVFGWQFSGGRVLTQVGSIAVIEGAKVYDRGDGSTD